MGKNVKKVISLVLVFAMILTGMTFTGFDAEAEDAASDWMVKCTLSEGMK